MPHIKVAPFKDRAPEADVSEATLIAADMDDHFQRDGTDVVAHACVAYFNHVHQTDGVIFPTPFHRALLTNDKEFYSQIITRLTDPMRNFVLNSPVNWDAKDATSSFSKDLQILRHFAETLDVLLEPDMRPRPRRVSITEELYEAVTCKFQEKWKVELPLSMIALTGDTKFLTQAVRDGGSLLSEDRKGNNLIHDLVYFSKENPASAVKSYHAILKFLINTSVKRKVVKHTNKKGKTPLDVAAQKHLPEIFLAIVNTEGVYKIVVKDCLLHKHVLYDVSEYESPLMSQTSPLHHFKGLTDEEVVRHDQCQFFSTEPVHSWIEARCAISRIFMKVWMLENTLYQALYWYCAFSYQFYFVMPHQATIALAVVSALMIVLGWALDFSRLKSDLKAVKKFFTQGRVPVTLTIFYAQFFSSFNYCTFLLCVMFLTGLNCNYPFATTVVFVASLNFATLTVLYLIQITRRAGHLLIILLKMMYDTIIFLCIAVIFFTAATNVFYALHYPTDTCSAHNKTLNWEESAANYIGVMYETFQLALAVKPFSREPLNGVDLVAADIFYVVTLLFFNIILLNMLIGVMSRRISDIEKHKDTLLKIETISVLVSSKHGQRASVWFKLGLPQKYFIVSKDFAKVHIQIIEKNH